MPGLYFFWDVFSSLSQEVDCRLVAEAVGLTIPSGGFRCPSCSPANGELSRGTLLVDAHRFVCSRTSCQVEGDALALVCLVCRSNRASAAEIVLLIKAG